MLLNILQFVQHQIKLAVQAGDTVIDATAGNGHDTVFLAQCVSNSGKVLAFDIQSSALLNTRNKLNELGLSDQVSLIQAGHEHMQKFCHTGVSAIMFNLGYLPGADKNCTTQVSTTLAALEAGLNILLKDGLISVVLYPGHEQGIIEAQAIEKWAAQLPQQQYEVLQYRFTNRIHHAPYALLLYKRI